MRACRRHIIHLLNDLMRTLPLTIGVIPERLQSVLQSAGTLIFFEALNEGLILQLVFPPLPIRQMRYQTLTWVGKYYGMYKSRCP